MIRQYPKTHEEKISDHFMLSEFHCKCDYADCVVTYLSEELVQGLEQLRKTTGPLYILSGFRCMQHNLDAGGKANSQHLLGQAADVASGSGETPLSIEKKAKRVPVFINGGIGRYWTFVHLDVRGVPARWLG